MRPLELIEAGGEKFREFATGRLRALTALRHDLRMPVMQKQYVVDGSHIWIKSSEWGDVIRITAGAALFAIAKYVSAGQPTVIRSLDQLLAKIADANVSDVVDARSLHVALDGTSALYANYSEDGPSDSITLERISAAGVASQLVVSVDLTDFAGIFALAGPQLKYLRLFRTTSPLRELFVNISDGSFQNTLIDTATAGASVFYTVGSTQVGRLNSEDNVVAAKIEADPALHTQTARRFLGTLHPDTGLPIWNGDTLVSVSDVEVEPDTFVQRYLQTAVTTISKDGSTTYTCLVRKVFDGSFIVVSYDVEVYKDLSLLATFNVPVLAITASGFALVAEPAVDGSVVAIEVRQLQGTSTRAETWVVNAAGGTQKIIDTGTVADVFKRTTPWGFKGTSDQLVLTENTGVGGEHVVRFYQLDAGSWVLRASASQFSILSPSDSGYAQGNLLTRKVLSTPTRTEFSRHSLARDPDTGVYSVASAVMGEVLHSVQIPQGDPPAEQTYTTSSGEMAWARGLI